MKKAYTKPEIVLVDFSLSSSIATTCKFDANFAVDVCSPVVEDNGWTYYNVQFSCDVPLDRESVCYHVPTADTSIFSS